MSSLDLQLHYSNNGITDYPKNKSGMPDMRASFNQKILETLTESKKEKEEEVNTCPICFESMTVKGYAVLGCSHSFCLDCLIKQAHIKQNCPMCRGDFKIDIKKEEKQKLKSIRSTMFSEILTRSKNVETFKYKGNPINFNEFMRIQFEYYKKNESQNTIETAKEGVDRLVEITTVLITEYYAQQLRE